MSMRKHSAIQDRILLVRQTNPFTVEQANGIISENLRRSPRKQITRIIIPESIMEVGVMTILENYGIECTVTYNRR